MALIWHEGVLVKKPDPDSFDERVHKRQLDRLLFERVRQAWEQGDPLSSKPQAADRFLPAKLHARPSLRDRN